LNDYNFGNFVCSLREKQGLTQADLARQLDVTPAAISKWENGSSKPRVEVLFQLAHILGVKPEELMAGHYIEEEHLDPDAVKMINEKYEYLRRVELHNSSKAKIFRLIAALIDWEIIGFTAIFVLASLVNTFKSSASFPNTAHILLILALILSYPVCFILRDLIFGGRSLGKRIMGLVILDKATGKSPKKLALALRGIFLFIMQADIIIMLITGQTLGDRVAHTLVVRKKDLSSIDQSPEKRVESINRYASDEAARSRSNKKKVIMWICIAATAMLLFIILLVCTTIGELNKSKETEEYKLAYEYVVQSEEFKSLGVEEDKLILTAHMLSHYTRGEETHSDATISFRVNLWREITVILHDEGDGWYVCEKCTGFN
jgi:transcriptional regulator with XRE-family HTH domain